jgi:hypothetical protein
VLFQSLARLFQKLLRDGLSDKQPSLCQAASNPALYSDNRDVNGFFGWAIGSYRMQVKDKIYEAKTILDEVKQKKLEKQMRYLKSLFIRNEEAILNETYVSECYDLGMRLKNMGGLTLVSHRYFEFARRVMTKIQTAITAETFVSNQNIVKETKVALKCDDGLFKTFLDLACQEIEDGHVSCVHVKKVLRALIEKVINAWSGEIIGQYKDQVTGRRGRLAGNDQAFRSQLKGRAIKTKKQKRKGNM